MRAATFQQMADRVAALLEDRLRIRGRGLSEKLRRGGKALPRHVRAAAEALARAAEQAQHPRLLVQIDPEAVAADYDICLRHLRDLNNRDRRIAMLSGVATSILFSLIAVAGLFVAVLYWRGFL